MGTRGSVIDLTVILLLCAHLTESATTRDTERKYSIDHRNDVNDKTVSPATNDHTQCKDIIEKKEGEMFFDPNTGETIRGTAEQCVQWCLEKITCVHVRHYGSQCAWTDVIKKLHRVAPGYTTYTVRYRCPKYHRCSDRVCRNDAVCMPLEGQEMGIECICAKGSSGWFCERQHCYDQLCQYGGTCRNTSMGFSCTCPPYRTGVLCETPTPSSIEGSRNKRLAIIVGSTIAAIAICGVCVATAIVAATVEAGAAADVTKEIT